RRGSLRQVAEGAVPARNPFPPLSSGQGSRAVQGHTGQAEAEEERPYGAGASSPRRSKREARLTFRRHIPAVRSPTFFTRSGVVFRVKSCGSTAVTSFQSRGVETRASATGWTE